MDDVPARPRTVCLDADSRNSTRKPTKAFGAPGRTGVFLALLSPSRHQRSWVLIVNKEGCRMERIEMRE